MIRFTQIKSAEEIAMLSDYCVLDICADRTDSEEPRINSVSVLKISERKVCSEAYLPLRAEEAGSTESTYSIDEIAAGLCKLFPGNVLAAEPDTVVLLRRILEQRNIEGEVLFLPVCRLASALFPLAAAVSPANPVQIADALSLPRPDVKEPLQTVYLEANLVERCRQALSPDGGMQEPSRLLIEPKQDDMHQGGKHSSGRRPLDSVSDETLKRLAKSAWSASPWVFAALAIAAFILALILFPHRSDKVVDRSKPPVSYIVLSWDKAGKYGTVPAKGSGSGQPVEFRIPYGVYRVQNNNSIPVELYILSEEGSPSENQTQEENSTVTLNADQEEDDETQAANGRVILRPNSDRQITIDEGQYLTLSENATDLILFYVSEVPEEPESDTTGQVAHGQSVIYAYVKGTEVRFRRAPSLEGQIIDSLNNGQQVQVLAISGEWTHVQVQDQKGYIFSQYLTTEDPNQKYMDSKNAESATSDEPQPESESGAADTPAESDSGVESTPPEPDAATPSGSSADNTTSEASP